MTFEQDDVEFLGGLRHGLTLGSPLAIRIGNTEWPKWETVMSPDPVDESALAAADDVNAEKEVARNRPLTRPRPGHADLVGMQKYGFEDARPILERASARETAARVALGAVASRVPRAGLRHPPRVAHRGDRHGRGRRGRRAADSRRRRPARRRPGAHARRRRVGRHGGRGRGRQEGRRHPGRRRRGRRLRRPAGPRLARALGPAARRAARRGADGDPGDQGRRGRRRVHDRPPSRLAGPRRDGARRRGRRSGGAPAGPAAPRAACRPARCSGYAPP